MKYSVSLNDKDWDFIYCAVDMLYEEWGYEPKSSYEYKMYEKSRKLMSKLDEALAQAKEKKQVRAASKATKLDHSAAEEIIAKKFGKLN